MIKKLSVCLAVVSIFSCNTEEKNEVGTNSVTTDTTTVADASSPSPSTDRSGCYLMVIEKDTASLQLTKTAGGYEGKLEYKRFEKDSNKGDVSLLEDEKYLKGWYRFQSEGVLSVREVFFRKTAKGLEEGYGEITAIGDTAMFKYPATLDYESRHPYVKTNCN